MGLKCGIVGLPNAGKSTIFNALTNSKAAESANYPFCTIDPNLGRVIVPDSRLDQISHIFQPEKTLPTLLEFVDIAGLVKGASQGEGLGNQFLSHIRSTDSLLQVVRGFEDRQITHVYDNIDPKRDIEIINTELLLADLEVVEKRFKKLEKQAQTTGQKELKLEVQVLKVVLDLLKADTPLRSKQWDREDLQYILPLNLITLK
ncbi:MAG: redox-regulated ATPase YchF, partial [Bdellovibrionales bacterium]